MGKPEATSVHRPDGIYVREAAKLIDAFVFVEMGTPVTLASAVCAIVNQIQPSVVFPKIKIHEHLLLVRLEILLEL